MGSTSTPVVARPAVWAVGSLIRPVAPRRPMIHRHVTCCECGFGGGSGRGRSSLPVSSPPAAFQYPPHDIGGMHHNHLQRRPGEGPVLHQDRVRQATRRIADDDGDCFELRCVIYMYYARGRTPEQIGDALDLPLEDVEEMKRRALKCL